LASTCKTAASGCTQCGLCQQPMLAAGLVPCDRMVLLRGGRHRVVALRDADLLKALPSYELVDLLGEKP
jgi:hypothetical protein